PARQSRGRPIERDISEANRVEKPKTRSDLAQYQTCDLFFAGVELNSIERFDRVSDSHRRVLSDAVAADSNGERVPTQTTSAARAANSRRHHLFDCDANFF